MTTSTAPRVPRTGQSGGEHETKHEIAPSAQQIREQLARILESPVFRNSKRYAAVLTYIVEQTLAGNTDQLKERTIGVDVFGRDPDYDTGSDHAVRSAMAEVRKRLAQYYQGDLPDGEWHLDLQPGSYVPQFRCPFPAELPHIEPRGRHVFRLRWTMAFASGILLLVLVVIVAVSLRNPASSDNSLRKFWSPVLASPRETLLCIGNLEGGKLPTAKESPSDLRGVDLGEFHRLPTQTIHVSDAIALAKFAGFLESRGKPWRVAAQSEATFSDLRNGPAILIGLMNNDWTERLNGKLRFRAEKIGSRTVVIRDTRHPSRNDWSLDYSTPLLQVTRDYALVLRFFDPNTGQPVITAAGISIFGTSAAAEFLTDPGEMNMLSGIAPGWEKKNLEIVLSTEVVRAKSGRPQIIATQVW
jgi:hypothetical protein